MISPSIRPSRGFTLVEMSIVLVILGLLVGGVLMGQNIMRRSDVTAVLSDVDYYFSAVSTFQQRYQALPGDMSNATASWGAANVVPAVCITTLGSGTATCNGNGDGRIGDTAGATYSEWFRAWQHLANAGLIQGQYTGLPGGGGNFHHIPTLNCPASAMAGTGFSLRYLGGAAVANYFSAAYGHVLHFGKASTASDPNFGALTPEEAYGIDLKMDDGMPATGKVMTQIGSSTAAPGCASSDVVTATYALTDKNTRCMMLFLAPF